MEQEISKIGIQYDYDMPSAELGEVTFTCTVSAVWSAVLLAESDIMK